MTSANSPFAGGGFGGNAPKGKAPKGKRYAIPHEDPLADVEVTGDLEKDSNAEVAAIGNAIEGFRERMKTEKKRFETAVDAGYWTGVCFRSSADLNKFFDALGTVELFDSQHLDGYALCKILGLDIDWEDD